LLSVTDALAFLIQAVSRKEDFEVESVHLAFSACYHGPFAVKGLTIDQIIETAKQA
jgi:hypothetical protein